MIKDVLRLKLHGGLSHEAIARSLSISKGVVAKYVTLAAAVRLDWDEAAGLGEAELERRLLGRDAELSKVVEPDFGRVHVELRRKGVTLTLLWQEYRAAHEGQRTWALTQFCEHYKRYTRTLRRSMRQHHRAGEKLFVDFAGPTLALADGGRGQVFVAALGASSYTYACVTADQSMRSWLAAIGRTLKFIGGVPQLIVPDNPRALITDANRYEPRVNDTVLRRRRRQPDERPRACPEPTGPPVIYSACTGPVARPEWGEQTMNKSMVAGAVLGGAAVLSIGAVAGYRSFTAPSYAEVVDVKPVKRVEKRREEECAMVPVTRRREVKDENRIVGTAVGAVVGGVIGHQIGGGRGQDLATVAGAVGGGYAGNRVQKGMQDRDTYTTEERRCTTVERPVDRVIGYDVRYTLNGRTDTVRMDHEPADRIPVKDGKLVLDAPKPESAGTR